MSTLDTEKILAIFRPGGALNMHLKGYMARSQQMQMVGDVVSSFNSNGIGLIEAGTGTGKSFAYLVPALLWAAIHKERVVISTNTINLQEQLFHKDIPQVKKVLGVDLKAVLVKGMGNYLCLRKLKDTEYEVDGLDSKDADSVRAILAWADTTSDGTKSDLNFQPRWDIWDKVNAEGDTCTGRQCPYYEECHFMRARKEAEDAQVLVVNHHLLFADLAQRASNEEENVGILPEWHHIIIDEAHHIEDVATEFFSGKTSRFDIIRTMGRIASEKGGEEGAGRLHVLKKRVEQAWRKERLTELSDLLIRLNQDLPIHRQAALQEITTLFNDVEEFFSGQLPRSNQEEVNMGEHKLRLLPQHTESALWKDEITLRVNSFSTSLKRYIQTIRGIDTELMAVRKNPFYEQVKGILTELLAYASRLEENCSFIEKYFLEKSRDNHLRWMEKRSSRSFSNLRLIDTELDISEHLFDDFFSKVKTAILCSATLSTDRKFGFFRERLGIDSKKVGNRKVIESIYDSPFNFEERSLLMVPHDMPMPGESNFLDAAVNSIYEAILACKGGVFVLFTSYTMLKACYGRLEKLLSEKKFPLFKQGDQPRRELLNAFKESGKGVLFGTDSFWEGVDVPGEALRCVIMVKLPFKVPSEPITEARSDLLKHQGKDPFYEYSLPSAIVKFKQGFGRLIRAHTDRGVILVLDSRLVKKGYGGHFLRSLPPCGVASIEVQEVKKTMEEFYRRIHV